MPTDQFISDLTEDSIGASDFVPIRRGSSNFRLNLLDSILDGIESKESVFNILNYGAVGDASTDNRAAIQAAHDAAETAGGGIVWVPEGIFVVAPSSGICLLFNGDKVKLIGAGANSILRFKTVGSGNSTVAGNNFEGIAPKGYNTTTTNYGASGLWVQDLRVETDDGVATATSTAESRNAHGLIGVVHAPWAIIKGVTFGDVVYHQIEVNRSKNVFVEDCLFIGNTESSRVQIDIGTAGQKSATPTATIMENIWFENCRFASRDATSQNIGVPRMIELDHSSNISWKNVGFNKCEFGAVYHTSASYLGYTIALDGTSLLYGEGLTITNCKFYGDCHGQTSGIHLIPGSGILRGVRIENNYFGSGYDCAGTRLAGGFTKCINIGTGSSPTNITGSSTVSTNYSNRSNIVVRNNVIMPRFVNGKSGATVAAILGAVMITTCLDAVIENNLIKLPVSGGTFTAATSDILTTTGSSTTDGMMVGDPLRFTSTTTLPAGLSAGVTYYVREILSGTTFTVSATEGGAVLDITSTGTGTHSWSNYTQSISISTICAFGIAEIANCVFKNNSVLIQHDSTTVPSYLPYVCIFNAQALEAASVWGWWEVTNNRLTEVGSGSCTVGMVEYATGATEVGSPYIRGIWAGNIHDGTFTTQNSLQGHPTWFDEGDTVIKVADTGSITSTTLGAYMSTRIIQAGRYKIFGKIIYTTAASTDGIKLAINGPTTTTLALFWSALTSDTGEVTELYTTTDGATFTTTTRPATGTAWVATVSGYATVSAAGAISLEAASEVGSSTILKAGSMLEITAV